MKYTGKLGFFDSGIGGLTVMNEFIKLYPEFDMVYFGDRANCPYGDRPPEEIITLVEKGVERLVEEGCVIIILACNTAVSQAVKYLQTEKYPPEGGVKILGVTLPGAEKVIESGITKVGVLATTATVKSRAYRDRVHLLDPNIHITEVAAPGLVNAIEKELGITDEIQAYICEAITQFEPDTEALVLGCTHYPIVAEEVLRIWREIHHTPLALIDPGKEAAIRFAAYLERHWEFELLKNKTRKTTLTQ